MKIRKAVITAAGWGTRFLPITKSMPKEMLPVVHKPLIQYCVEEAVACGIEFIVIVTALGKRAIEDYFDRSLELERVLEEKGEFKLAEEMRRLSDMVDICYVRQKEQLGLGHAVLAARSAIGNEPFLLLLPDDLFEHGENVLKQMTEVYQKQQSSVLAVQRVEKKEVERYGIITPANAGERTYRVLGLVEKPKAEEAPSDLAVVGRYILTPDVFRTLAGTTPGRNNEIQLTDALQRLLQKQPIYAYEVKGQRFDAGTLSGWLKTNLALALTDPDIGPGLKEYLKNLI